MPNPQSKLLEGSRPDTTPAVPAPNSQAGGSSRKEEKGHEQSSLQEELEKERRSMKQMKTKILIQMTIIPVEVTGNVNKDHMIPLSTPKPPGLKRKG